MAGKGQDRFSALSTRDLVSVEVAHLKVRFELAEKSVLAERAVALVNAALDGLRSRKYSQQQAAIGIHGTVTVDEMVPGTGRETIIVPSGVVA